MPAPLEGIKVLDFSQVGAIPACAMILGDLGADVIKIERLEGENLRHGQVEAMPWKDATEGLVDDTWWTAWHRSKRDLAIDLQHQKGREVVLTLARDADIAMHNFRPGVMEKLGLDYKALSAVNPRIIYLSLYAYGEKGPLKQRAGADCWLQAMSGMVAYLGSPGQPPTLLGVPIVDIAGAVWGALAAILGLAVRERFGIAQEIGVNFLGVGSFFSIGELAEYLTDGKLHKKIGRGWRNTFPYGAYPASDGDVVTMYGMGKTWSTFCKVLGVERLLEAPRYDTQEKREQHKEELYPILDEAFRKRTRAEWQQAFKEAKLRVDPALDYSELVNHPQFKENEMCIELDHPAKGGIRMLALPLLLKETPITYKRPAPILGQHTGEILSEAGYGEGEIEELIREGVVRTPTRWVRHETRAIENE